MTRTDAWPGLLDFLHPLPRLRAAFAYGSGVFQQAGYTGSMLDLVIVTDDPAGVHAQLIRRFPEHYAWLPRSVPSLRQTVHSSRPAGVYYNPGVRVPNVPVPIKYGVVAGADLQRDLVAWDALFLAGRLHKPVRFVLPPQPGSDLARALRTNLISAATVAAEVTRLPCSEHVFLNAVAGLSYTGDLRVGLAEHPDKVQNIVRGNYPRFAALYSDDILAEAGLARRCGSGSGGDKPAGTHVVKIPASGAETTAAQRRRRLPAAVAHQVAAGASVEQAVQRIVRGSSRRQILFGILSGGVGRSIAYGLDKVRKKLTAR